MSVKNFPELVATFLMGWPLGERKRKRENLWSSGRRGKREDHRPCGGHMGVKVLTLYAFSTENWKRPPIEVRFLMKLFKSYLISQLRELVEDNVQVHIVGEPSALSDDLRREIAACEKDTAKCDGMILNVAINYGGRMEIVQAVQQIAREVKRGSLDANPLRKKRFLPISIHQMPRMWIS